VFKEAMMKRFKTFFFWLGFLAFSSETLMPLFVEIVGIEIVLEKESKEDNEEKEDKEESEPKSASEKQLEPYISLANSSKARLKRAKAPGLNQNGTLMVSLCHLDVSVPPPDFQ
jgi:hypothetical protein